MSNNDNPTISRDDFVNIAKTVGRAQAVEDQIVALTEALIAKDALDINVLRARLAKVRLLSGDVTDGHRESMKRLHDVINPARKNAGG